jgi:16S rRNA (guanine1207-N2)-methyltransferase
MNEHYWTAQPTSNPQENEITATLRGRTFRFLTGAGVFSAERVDPGSRQLIKAVALKDGDTVLDLGCGYGPVGIALAPLTPHGKVYLVDPNERAADMAKRNLGLNDITNAEVRVGAGCAPVVDIRFDVIATNPPIRLGNAVLRGLMAESRECLAPDGVFYLVARTQQGARSLARMMQEIVGPTAEIEKGSGYRVYAARR